MMEENAASNRRYQHLPPEVARSQRHLAINNSDETLEELHTEEELHGEPAPPAQKKVSSKIKSTIPVENDDLSLADSWGDCNFAQAETAAAVTEFEEAG